VPPQCFPSLKSGAVLQFADRDLSDAPQARPDRPRPRDRDLPIAPYIADFIPAVVLGPVFYNINMVSVLFWAGFAPSLWTWLYVLALFVTRTILRSERIVRWLRWFLDVEKNPFRSIGAVAAALAFIASVAILLISAEVSRVTAAT
jgi:hypothetical protein